MHVLIYIVVTIITCYCNTLIGTIHDNRHIHTPKEQLLVPLYDVWYSNFGAPLINYSYLPDILIWINILLLIPCLVYNTFIHFINVLCFLFTIRGLCIFSTSGYVSYRKKNTDVLLVTSINNSYTDMVISGHTMTSILLFCHIYDSECSSLYVIISSIITFFSIFTILLVGDHYVSDILIGLTLSFLSHYSIFF